jgi:N-acetylmuramoyl-L-alanine amidase
MSEKVIVSAAGHGGQHPGAVHPPLIEKDLTLWLDNAFTAALQRKYTGFRHIRARTSDTTVTLAQRVTLAKQNSADCFLEFHFNGGGGTGPETYIARNHTAADLALARTVHSRLHSYLGQTFKVPDRGIKKADFYVLRETASIPSILPEILFLDHSTDRAAIQTPGFFNAVGEALADGVAGFLRLPLRDNEAELRREIERLREENAHVRKQYEAAQAEANEFRGQLRRIQAIIKV